MPPVAGGPHLGAQLAEAEQVCHVGLHRVRPDLQQFVDARFGRQRRAIGVVLAHRIGVVGFGERQQDLRLLAAVGLVRSGDGSGNRRP